jgi:hypothetical protein
MKPRKIITIVVSIALSWAALIFWAVHSGKAREEREINDRLESALCVLELQAGQQAASASFTTSKGAGQFHVSARPGARRERLALSFSGSSRESFNGDVTEFERFGLGNADRPGTWTVTLRQKTGNGGGIVIISGEKPAPPTGLWWPIWPHGFLILLALSGAWASIARKSQNLRLRMQTVLTFQIFLLAFVVVFTYLLFHEGGHALGEIAFGRFDFARADFWGIHGRPHSGGTSGPQLEPWQRALITSGGPMLPIFAGWALFLFWRSRIGRNSRSRRPIVNLYLSAVIAMLVLPIVLAGCLLGVISDHETQAAISIMPGPSWLGKSLLWGVVLVSAVILWRVVPEIWKVGKAQVLELRKLPTRGSGA